MQKIRPTLRNCQACFMLKSGVKISSRMRHTCSEKDVLYEYKDEPEEKVFEEHGIIYKGDEVNGYTVYFS